ncbi:MAG: class I SAM-dependent methyltransferase [Candidatus Paceibacterota bacterium]|jgi:ubiquinone/menaquinone biosynthesis C-methylase UbiE
MKKSYWHQKAVVNAFTNYKPSLALSRFLNKLSNPNLITILDLGCGGGRNTEMIFKKGFNVYACDNSTAMVQQTKRRMSKIIQRKTIKLNIAKATMIKLPYKSNFFDVVVSIGVFHNATSVDMLSRTIGEASRVLKHKGKLYLNIFYEFRNMTGAKKLNTTNVYLASSGLKMTLLNRKDLLRIFKNFGFKLCSSVRLYKRKLNVGDRGVFRAVFIKNSK